MLNTAGSIAIPSVKFLRNNKCRILNFQNISSEGVSRSIRANLSFCWFLLLSFTLVGVRVSYLLLKMRMLNYTSINNFKSVFLLGLLHHSRRISYNSITSHKGAPFLRFLTEISHFLSHLHNNELQTDPSQEGTRHSMQWTPKYTFEWKLVKILLRSNKKTI